VSEFGQTFRGDGLHLVRRRIVTAKKRFIAKYALFKEAGLQRVEHDGILSRYNPSVVFYFDRGRWIELPVRE